MALDGFAGHAYIVPIMRKRTGLTHEEVVIQLKAMQGERSLRKFAEDLGISAAYLSDIFHGQRAVGPSILKQLGLTKNVTTNVSYSASEKSVSA